MGLITEEDLKHFEAIGNQGDKPAEEQMVVCKLFLTGTRRTWYLTEYDPVEQIAWGYVKSGIEPLYDERGSIYIPELEELVIKIPLLYAGTGVGVEIPYKVERDDYFYGPKLFTSLQGELDD